MCGVVGAERDIYSYSGASHLTTNFGTGVSRKTVLSTRLSGLSKSYDTGNPCCLAPRTFVALVGYRGCLVTLRVYSHEERDRRHHELLEENRRKEESERMRKERERERRLRAEEAARKEMERFDREEVALDVFLKRLDASGHSKRSDKGSGKVSLDVAMPVLFGEIDSLREELRERDRERVERERETQTRIAQLEGTVTQLQKDSLANQRLILQQLAQMQNRPTATDPVAPPAKRGPEGKE
ncbi:hypothetical protein KIPB_002351 [Kipferlia bialata]|uniref:Uncharacterized protein n=1 Tax=Kipferlia bialata TaxID=797122 RepID=A0A9K3CS24_9EUKA|nr:hypothetical protein KIPB_002351 [Kipferlia bialata]|eukprot:g2351.t1